MQVPGTPTSPKPEVTGTPTEPTGTPGAFTAPRPTSPDAGTVPTASTNPYTALIDQDQADQNMAALQAQIPRDGEANPYTTILDDDEKRRQTALRSAVIPAMQVDPDKHAQNLTLAKGAGLPVGAVEQDPQSVAYEQRLNQIVDTVSKSPTLQAWMMQDDNAILSMDDYENLSGMEKAIRSTGDLIKSPFRGFDTSVGQGISGLGRINDAMAHGMIKGVRAIGLDSAANVLETPIPYWADPSHWFKSIGGAIERMGGPPLDEKRRNFGTDVGEGIGSLIGQMIVSRVNPAAGVTLMAGQGAEQTGRTAEQAGATQEQQDAAALLGATVTGASEKIGLDILLERLPPNIKNQAVRWLVDKAIAAGSEGTQEAVEQMGQNLVAKMLYDPNAPIFEGVKDNASVGAAVGLLARTLLGVHSHAHEAQQVKGEQTTLDGMVQAADASTLRQRAPERFSDLIQTMAKNGAENVYVPVEQATKLFQSMDPPQIAEALGVPLETYMEARITGGDVAIPLETYLTRVAPEYHEQLRDVARFSPGSMTPEEAAHMEEQAKDAADRFVASATEERASDKRVYDDVSGMLLGTGRYRREDVEKYAQIMQAGFRTMAAREGVDPFELYQRYRLRIKSELPAVLQNTDIDTVIDPLIERLRSGGVPRGSQRQSLSDFLAANGGITDKKLKGEIATIHENDRALRKGKPRLVREDAKVDLDRAREAAAEAGYIKPDSDINDLLDAIDREQSGHPVYAMGDDVMTQDDMTRHAIDSLDEELSRRGIDIHKTSNEDIKKALFGEGDVPQVPDELVKVFDQPAYHGTPHEVDRFSLNKIGSGEGNQAFGWGLYFASNKDIAEAYRKKLTGISKMPGAAEAEAMLTKTGGDRAEAIRLLKRKGDEKAVEFLRRDVNRGNTYQVDVPHDSDLLDYDKHLDEQPKAVQDALEAERKKYRDSNGEDGAYVSGTGEQIYREFVKAYGSEKAASERLNELGIPGLRYADGATRSKDGKQSHNYVIWDENAVSEPTKLFQSEGLRPFAGMTRDKFLGNPKITSNANAADLVPRAYSFLDDVKAEPFAAGDGLTAKYAPDGAAVFDGDKVIASYNSGDTLVVDKKYRRQGIGEELAYQWRMRNPDAKPAATRTKASQALQEKVWDRIQSEHGSEPTKLFQSEDGSSVDQTKTPEFKQWFGDSKVVDANGDPLIVYHGTSANFETFHSQPGKSSPWLFGNDDNGFFFTTEPGRRSDSGPWSGAAGYAGVSQRDGETVAKAGANILPVYLSIAFPYRMTAAHYRERGSRPNFKDELEALGYDGIKIDDGTWVAFRQDQIKSATGNRGTFDKNDPSILNQSDRAAEAIRRGYIKFGGDRQFTIGLLEKADATTFLHETGHFFLEVMGDLASKENASPELKQDYQTLLDWFGVKSKEDIGTDQHEQFARGFEQYLGEGKAPTPELSGAFARFRAWVKAIYKTLTALNVPLTDDVRKVMDRMLASDEEISHAEQSMDYSSLFKDANSAGWSDAEFATRMRMGQQARDEAESNLMAKAMKDVTREQKAWWNERVGEMRGEVEQEVHQMPVYRALSLLQDGTEPDGTPIDGAGQKLDKKWLVSQYGQEWLNKHLLRKRVYSVAGGADPDIVAHQTGFESGDEMVKALANAQPMEALIRAQTHQRMIDQYGDMLTDGSMPEAAMRAVHSNKRFQAMEADLRQLEKLSGEPRPSAGQLRAVANAVVGQKRVRDLAPGTYLRAERRAAKEAIQSAGRGEWGKALEAQRRRLLNAHLYDVSSRAVDETEKLQKYIRRFEKPALRARLGKIGRLDQVDALLSQYDLRNRSNKQIDQSKARGELLKLIESGEVSAPQSVVRSLQQDKRTNWRDMTVEDLRGVRDILAQTEASARAEYEAYVNGEKVKLDDVAEQIAGSTLQHNKRVPPVVGEQSPAERAKSAVGDYFAATRRPSSVARLLDGGEDFGAWTKHVIVPIRRAVSEKLEPMKRKVNEDLTKLYKDHYSVKDMAQMNERQMVPGINMPLSKWDLISLALNWGNAENQKAVLDSEIAGRKPFTQSGVEEALGTLTANDWHFVQGVWDYVDSYWSQIEASQKRRKGIAPPKVEAQPFTMQTADGQTVDLKGGYYPLKYNSRLDAKARQHEMDDAYERMKSGTLSSTQTKYGHTQERVGSGRQPVMLSMNVLHSHLNNVVHDLALGDTVNYVDRVLNKHQIRKSMIETGNLDKQQALKLWLKDVATGEMGARSGPEQIAKYLRMSFTKSKLAFNLATGVKQLFGMAQSIPVVGATNVAKAAASFSGRPFEAVKDVMQQSDFMRSRYETNNFNKDIAAVQDALHGGAPVGKGSGKLGGFIRAVKIAGMPPKVVNWAFLSIRAMQMIVDSVTWTAGYNKGSSEGMSHKDAVHYADSVVENAQTSGFFSDRSPIERGTLSDNVRQSEYVKIWTTLMGPMIAKGNIAHEKFKATDFKKPGQVLAFGTHMITLFAVEALLTDLMMGGLPDKEDGAGWFQWLAKTMGSNAMQTLPFFREIPSMAYGSGNTPIGGTANDIFKAAQQTGQGEMDEALVKSYANMIGTTTGLPSTQFNRFVDAYWRDHQGQDVPFYEYVLGKRQEAKKK